MEEGKVSHFFGQRNAVVLVASGLVNLQAPKLDYLFDHLEAGRKQGPRLNLSGWSQLRTQVVRNLPYGLLRHGELERGQGMWLPIGKRSLLQLHRIASDH